MENEQQQNEGYWVNIADLMSVLMMVFLFIAISYMLEIEKKNDNIKKIAVTYNKIQNELIKDLQEEFKYDLEKWNASIDTVTLSVEFNAPEILFERGKAIVKYKFKKILDDFFPRFLHIVRKQEYQGDIEEIKIEGHTSSESSYIFNMELSQKRAYNTFVYLYNTQNDSDKKWARQYITVDGYSYSRIKYKTSAKKEEDKNASRRVQFRIKTNSETRIKKIIDF